MLVSMVAPEERIAQDHERAWTPDDEEVGVLLLLSSCSLIFDHNGGRACTRRCHFRAPKDLQPFHFL